MKCHTRFPRNNSPVYTNCKKQIKHQYYPVRRNTHKNFGYLIVTVVYHINKFLNFVVLKFGTDNLHFTI